MFKSESRDGSELREVEPQDWDIKPRLRRTSADIVQQAAGMKATMVMKTRPSHRHHREKWDHVVSFTLGERNAKASRTISSSCVFLETLAINFWAPTTPALNV